MSTLRARATDLLRSWGYDHSPAAAGNRDLRIDLLRGFCVFVMIVDHVGGSSSWLYVLTGGNRFFVSAAEGFVFLSGISMGLVHSGVIQRTGVRAMLEKVFGRAWFLYALTVILTITFAAASGALGTPWAASATPAKSGGDFALTVLTFRRSYSLTDVLLLYTLLVAAAGPALWLIARGRTALVLGSSVALWTAAQLSPTGWIGPLDPLDGGFPFAAWQVLFFFGLAIGFHRQHLARWLAPARLLALGIAAVLALIAVEAVTQQLFGSRSGVDVQQLLFDKNDARIGRVIALVAAASFGFALVSFAWAPLRRWTGWLLMPFGQQTLFAYGVQLFVVAFWSSTLVGPLRVDHENALFQGAAVAMVWIACVARPGVLAWSRRLEPRDLVPAARRSLAGAALVIPLIIVSGASASGLGDGLLPRVAETTATEAPDPAPVVIPPTEARRHHRPAFVMGVVATW